MLNQVDASHSLLRHSPRRLWNELIEPYQSFVNRVDEALKKQVETFEPEIAEHAKYVISSRGKRLRPLLVGMTGGAEKGFEQSLVNVAAIIEMVHLATLVHDDILDAAQMRHNRPTLASRFGNDTSVLLGDCLFAHALQLAAAFPSTEVCESVASATKRVCSGEILQTLNHSTKPNRAQYYRMIEMKTAELFGLSCALGARYGKGFESQGERLRGYGLALGTAYQVYDDCLDLFGSEAMSGKSLGTDLIKKKQTLPIIILLEKSTEPEKTQIISKLNHWDQSQKDHDDHHEWLMTHLARHQVLEDSQKVMGTFLKKARASLTEMERSRSRSNLNSSSESDSESDSDSDSDSSLSSNSDSSSISDSNSGSNSIVALYKLSDFLELKVEAMTSVWLSNHRQMIEQ